MHYFLTIDVAKSKSMVSLISSSSDVLIEPLKLIILLLILLILAAFRKHTFQANLQI